MMEIEQEVGKGAVDLPGQPRPIRRGLERTIRSLGPEANQLFDEINAGMKNGNGPGEEALAPLLGGVSGMGK